MHKLVSGGPLKIYASDWNQIVDAIEAVRKGEENHAYNRSAIRTYVQVYNGTGSVAEEGTAWELGSPQITPSDNIEQFQSHPVFSIKKPSSETEGTLCVLTAPINPSEQGIGIVTGAVAVKCDVNDNGDRWAKPDGNGGMTTGADGTVQLVYADKSTGWCYAILGAGGAGDRYRGYFATSIRQNEGEKVIHIDSGRVFLQGVPMSVQGGDIGYTSNGTILLSYTNEGTFSFSVSSPFQWSKEHTCTVIAEMNNGVLRQICHDMPTLWLVGRCDSREEP